MSSPIQILNGPGLGNISAGSNPIYDTCRWNPMSVCSGWSCADWMAWHKALVKVHGKAKANEIWLKAWNDQSSWTYTYSWCKYNSDWVSYLSSQGIDTRSWVSAIVMPIADTAINVVDSASQVVTNVADTAAKTSNVTKYLLPLAVTGIVAFVGFYAYKNFIKGDDKIKDHVPKPSLSGKSKSKRKSRK